jgi:RNA polymerase sigma-70 factor (ECF subfamily)
MGDSFFRPTVALQATIHKEPLMGAADNNEAVALAAQAAAGDTHAQRRLVERLHRRVQSIALSILGNARDAEDATQVILMEILKCIGSFRGESLTGWSDRIAARTAIRHARQRRIHGLRFEATEDLDNLAWSKDTAYADADHARDLRDYLAQLPEARREVLVLRHMLDYSIDEIAELTEVSPNTVKDRLLHAREQMRRLIRRDRMMDQSRGGV